MEVFFLDKKNIYYLLFRANTIIQYKRSRGKTEKKSYDRPLLIENVRPKLPAVGVVVVAVNIRYNSGISSRGTGATIAAIDI